MKKKIFVLLTALLCIVCVFMFASCDEGDDTSEPVAKIPITGVVFSDTTFSYDGLAHSLSISGTPLPEGVSVSYFGNDQSEVGVYAVTATFTDSTGLYEVPEPMTAVLTIVKDGTYFTLTYVDEAGKKISTVAVRYGAQPDPTLIPAVPEKAGYDGVWSNQEWYLGVLEDCTITPTYMPHPYRITYHTDGSQNNVKNPETYTISSGMITLYDPINSAGRLFEGWYTSPDFEESTRITKIESGSQGDRELYAKFLDYRIETAEGFTFDYESYQLPAVVTTVASSRSVIMLSTLIQVSEGCSWSLSKNFDGTQPLANKNMSLAEGDNVAYITVWYGNEYNIVYELHVYRLGQREYTFMVESTPIIGPTTVEERTMITDPALEQDQTVWTNAKLGYTFVGWSTVYGDVEHLVTFPYQLDVGTVFYAAYTPNTYTVTYNQSEADVQVQNPTTYQVITDTIVLAEPQKTGYTFTGWYTAETDGDKITEIAKGSIGDLVLYARFTPNVYQVQYYWGSDLVYTDDVPYNSTYTFRAEGDLGGTAYGLVHWQHPNGTYQAGQQITWKYTEGLVLTSKTTYSGTDFTISTSGKNATVTEYAGSQTKVLIPDLIIKSGVTYTVTSIGNYAFRICSGLTSITIPESVTSIGDFAFLGCSELTSITIPNSVTSIGSYAFGNCSKLTAVYITDLAAWCNISFDAYGANPLSYAKNLYLNGNQVTALEIPEGVTSIGSYAFHNCSSLTSITIPNSVESLGSYAFKYCTNLSELTIGNSVRDIGDEAFYGCSRLTSITIPESVTSIGDDAFYYCSGLTAVYITDLAAWCKISFYDYSSNPLNYAKNLYLNGNKVTALEIPEGVTSIGSFAFSSRSGLTSVTIGSGVTSISNSAFYGCSGLESITVASGNTKYHSAGNCLIETASKALVLGCKNSVVPADGSVTSISNSAFYGCSGLTSITIPNSVESLGSYAFKYCTNLSELTIGNSVRDIGSGAFDGCSRLMSITIPNSVTSIGEWAFYNCSGLTAVYITDLAAWCNISFCDSYSNPLCYANNLYLNGNKVTALEIPSGVTSIGKYAFSNCSGLESITVASGNTKYHSVGNCLIETASKTLVLGCKNSVIPTDGSVTSIGERAFAGCRSLTSITIPNSVTSIGGFAFSGCSGLTSITIPNSVTSIGDSAFSGCSGLTSITIPNSVTSIGSYAFHYCSSLTSITIPNSVTSIRSSAFSYCSRLTSINYRGTEAQWNAITKGSGWNFYTGNYTINYNYTGE